MRDARIGWRSDGAHTRRELAGDPCDYGQGPELHVRRWDDDDTAPLGVIASLGLISQYAIETFATELTARTPWIYAPLWGTLVVVGMVGSAIIGHRAGRKDADGGAIRSAGIRVFLFWLAVAAAAFLVPAAGGMWNADDGANIPRVAIGIVALGHILFGIMHRPVIAAVGAGIAVAFYVPSYLAGDAAPVVTAAAILIVVALSAVWIRKSGVL